jgi:flagellar assembly protein FliH
MTDEGSIDYLPWRAPEVEDSRELRHVDSEAARKLAWEQGYADGYTIGIEAGTRDARQRMGYLHEILESLAKPFADLDESVAGQLTVLVRTLAEQLVRRELQADSSVVAELVDEGLAALPVAGSDVRIFVNPDDATFIGQHMQEKSGVNYRIQSDATVSRGGCRIDTQFAGADATLETRLDRIVESMLDSRADEDADT